jgi:proteasome lid subunit RPN8/RPN11
MDTEEYSVNGLWYSEDPAVNNEIIFEQDIPVFFEEEIVSENYEDDIVESESSEESLIPTVNVQDVKETKYTKTLADSLKINQRERQQHNQNSGSHTPQNSANFKPFVLNEHTMRIFKNKIKAIQKRRAQTLAREKKQRPKKAKTLPPPPPAQVLKKHHQTSSSSSSQHFPKRPEVLEYYKPKPSVDPKNSGEILRMEKVDSDDIEIDILSNSEDEDNVEIDIADIEEDDESAETSIDDADGSFTETVPIENDLETLKKLEDLREQDAETFNFLENTNPPNWLNLDVTNVTPLEKFMLSEFFIGSSTKTPERYLKIRNHIISLWNQCRPNYLSKTAARQGLKKCGDVNSISRVHLTLENIGAINHGCLEVKYILPLKTLYELFQQSIRNKIQSNQKSKLDLSMSVSDNGTTKSVISDSMVNRIKSRTQSRTQFELIKCQRFSKDNVAPFEISITLSCLLCCYFHALSSKLEIMGFLGGHIDKNNGRDKIHLKCYKPCRTSTQTPISAEMCPVSQVEQSADLTESGFELLGWFHSHPNFPPIPSRTDLRTQNEIQLQFAPNNPFIGFILSCLEMDFK